MMKDELKNQFPGTSTANSFFELAFIVHLSAFIVVLLWLITFAPGGSAIF